MKSSYNSQPFDYQISSAAYHKLFENRDMQHFVITIEDVTYDFSLKISSVNTMNYIIKTIKDGKMSNILDSFSFNDISDTYDFENDGFNNSSISKTDITQSEKNELLRRLFLGKTIMIDNLNISFLHLAAHTIGIPELAQIRDISHESCIKQGNQFIFNYQKNIFNIPSSCKSFFFHLWTNVFNFFHFLGFFGRVLQSFWDLSGPTMIMCLFINLLILFITMALITMKNQLACFFIIVIPLLLYSLYFPNIIIVSIIEALERNLFFKKTFFYSHQKLISMLVKIFSDKEAIPKYIYLGRLHSFIHGILFSIFILGFFSNFFNVKAPRFLNVWIVIFVFYISLIRYVSLYVLYLVHSIVSLFNYPRRRFLEIRDFDDPYLCSFYLRQRNWIDFFLTKGKKAKLAHKGRLLIRMIFSKTTFSVVLTIAIIIYMGCADPKMSAGQICITLFIGFCMIFVLSTRISFPFFWLRRIKGRKYTEGKLEEMYENIDIVAQTRILRYRLSTEKNEGLLNQISSDAEDSISSNDDVDSECEEILSKIDEVDNNIRNMVVRQEVLKWHIEATTWGKRYKWLRWTSLILVILIFLTIIILVILGGTTAVTTFNKPSLYQKEKELETKYNITNKFSSSSNNNKNVSFRHPLSPICYLKPKGLTITEIIALTMLSDSPTPDYFTLLENLVYYQFLSHKNIIFENTSFWFDESFLSSMTLTRFRNDPKLSVFAIRGTSNFQDLIADAEIWFSSTVVNVMNAFFPFVSFYSDKTIELIGVVTNLPRYAFKQFTLVEEYKSRFIDLIYEYVYGDNANEESNLKIGNDDFFNSLKKMKSGRKKKSKKIPFHIDPDEDVMIIGHSLGGGLAKILSLVTGIQAVAISGPGIRIIGQFYQNKTVKNVKKTIVDIVPDQDLVAQVDMNIGTQIQVPCKSGLNCHDPSRLICQVSVMCNTYQKHKEFCGLMFDKDTIDEMFEIGEVVT